MSKKLRICREIQQRKILQPLNPPPFATASTPINPINPIRPLHRLFLLQNSLSLSYSPCTSPCTTGSSGQFIQYYNPICQNNFSNEKDWKTRRDKNCPLDWWKHRSAIRAWYVISFRDRNQTRKNPPAFSSQQSTLYPMPTVPKKNVNSIQNMVSRKSHTSQRVVREKA